MDYIDRSRIPAIHAAASRARSEYVHNLLSRVIAYFASGSRPAPLATRHV